MILRYCISNFNNVRDNNDLGMSHKVTFPFHNHLCNAVHAAPPLVLRTQPNVGKTLGVAAVVWTQLLSRRSCCFVVRGR